MCSLETLTFTNPPEVENNPGSNEAGILTVVRLVAAKFTLRPTVWVMSPDTLHETAKKQGQMKGLQLSSLLQFWKQKLHSGKWKPKLGLTDSIAEPSPRPCPERWNMMAKRRAAFAILLSETAKSDCKLRTASRSCAGASGSRSASKTSETVGTRTAKGVALWHSHEYHEYSIRAFKRQPRTWELSTRSNGQSNRNYQASGIGALGPRVPRKSVS